MNDKKYTSASYGSVTYTASHRWTNPNDILDVEDKWRRKGFRLKVKKRYGIYKQRLAIPGMENRNMD